jgi:hypothetical protein
MKKNVMKIFKANLIFYKGLLVGYIQKYQNLLLSAKKTAPPISPPKWPAWLTLL